MPSTHRHSVVLPLLALLLAVSAMGAQKSIPLNAQSAHGLSVHALASGGSADIAAGSIWQDGYGEALLDEGSALVHSTAPAVVRIGSLRATVLGGGAFFSRDDASVTVAAVTGPVLVEAGKAFVAVPVGMQWTLYGDVLPLIEDGADAWIAARTLSPLPDRFLREERNALAALSASYDLPASIDGDVPQVPVAVLTLQLSEALKRRSEEWREKVLGVLRSRIEREDIAAVQEILQRNDLADIRSSPHFTAVLMELALATTSVAMQQTLLPVLATDPDTLLLLTLEPSLTDVAWTMESGHMGTERTAARVLAFPFADTVAGAGRGFAWGRWREDFGTFLASFENPRDAAIGSLDVLGRLATLRDRQGYPERARLLAHALLEHAGAISSDARGADTLEQLRNLDRVSASTSSVSVVVSAPVASSAASEHSFDPALTQARARAILQSAGALVSLQTRITAEAEAIARIDDIVFGGSGIDRTVSFLLDTERRQVSGITEGSETFPFPMPWEDFVSWVTR